MPRYNYSTNKWEKTQEDIEEEQRKIIEEQQRQQQLAQQQSNNSKKKGFFDNLKSNWFKTPEAFKDGYDFGDVTKTLFGTTGKVASEFTKGLLNIGEGIGDRINYGIAWGADKLGAHDFAENLKNETKKDLFNDYLKPNDEIYGKNSITDRKVDNIVNSLGYIYGLQATAGMGKTKGAQTLISTAVTFESSYGHAMSEAYNAGATDDEARKYALIDATAEAGSELLFGGLGKGTNAVGLSSGIGGFDDQVINYLTRSFKNKITKNLSQWALKASAEGLEEIISGYFSAWGKKLTYMKDEDFNKILKDEQLGEQFISAFVSSGISSAPGMAKATKAGQNYITGRTAGEQEIYDKMVETKTNEKLSEKNSKLKQKAIDDEVKKVIADKKEKFGNLNIDEESIRKDVEKNIDFDESTTKLSKKELAEINESVDEAFEKGKLNFNDIYDTFTPEETNKLTRLDKELSNSDLNEELRKKYEQEFESTLQQREEKINKIAEDNAFVRSTLYNDQLKRTNFELTKEEQKLVDENKDLKNLYDDAVKYGNNSVEAHKFVNALAKMSTQTEYQYRLTDTKELNQLGYKVNNKDAVVNGLHDGDNKTIYINMDSENALNIIVGHETGHIFENTQEYKELQEMLFKVAEEDGTLEARRAELKELYKNVKNADIDVELTNDLLGEKLFTDEKFIERLAQKPNLFTKIKDKIDDLVIQFKGTEEEKELRKIQNKFLEVYRKNNLQEYVSEADAQAKKAKGAELKISKKPVFKETKYDLANNRYLDYNTNKWKSIPYELISYISVEPGKAKYLAYSTSEKFYELELNEMDKAIAESGNAVYNSLKNHKYKGYFNTDNYTFKYVIFDENGMFGITDAKPIDLEVVGGVNEEYNNANSSYNEEKIFKKRGNINSELAEDTRRSSRAIRLDEETRYRNTNRIGNSRQDRGNTKEVDNTSFSLSVKDNKGRTLTTEEQQKLRNSKARDEDGRLMELYHGTRHNFDEFTIGSGEHGDGFYFTEDSNYANEFADDENGRVIKAYLNLENPLSKNIDINDEATKKFINEIENKWGLSESEIIECFNSEEWSSDLGAKVAEKMGYGKQDVENTLGFEIDSPEDFGITDYNAYLGAYAWNNGLNDLVRESGFDGIISRTYNSTSEDYEYIAFNNNQIVQIKDNNNLAPIKTNNLNEYIADVSAREAKQNALDKESVRQSIMDYLEENDITNPTKEDMMNAFDDYDVMDNSDTLNDANKAEKLYSEVADEILKENNSKYSLSTTDNQGRNLSKEQQEYFKNSKARDDDGKLITFYHGTEANVGLPSEEKFTIFDRDRAGSHGSYYGSGFYFTTSLEDAKDYAHSKGDIYEVYLNIENPYIPSSDTINSDGKVEFAPSFYQDFENRFKDQLPQYWNDDTTNKGRVVRNILQDNGYDGVINGNTYVAFESKQIKNVDNTNPTSNEDIRYSLSKNNNYTKEENELIDKYTSKYIGMNNRQLNKEFTYANDSYQEMIKLYNDASKEYKEYQKTEDFLNALHNYDFESEAWKKGDEYADKIRYYDREAKRYFAEREAINNILLGQDVDTRSKEEIVKEAEKHFGITNDFKEAGYIDLNGKLLDFSGAHKGGTRGQRSLDHRQINEIDTDYDTFIASGNIRILPENGGINLEVEPNTKQYDMLRKYIDYTKQNNQDEIYIDVVTPNGYDSIRYNPNTSTSKIINDLKEYYETGKFPKKSEFADFIQYSLSTKDNKGRQLSNDQRDYFRMAKTKDEYGNLLTLYHGSNSEFTIFDITKSGESNKSARVGFWFTPSEQGAKNFASDIWYGDNKPTTYEVYLNITNPKIYESFDNAEQTNSLSEEYKKSRNKEKALYEKHEYDNIGMSNVIAFLNYKSEENTIKTLVNDFGYTEEQAKEYIKEAKEVQEIRKESTRLEKEVENSRYTDSYEQFRTDIYKIAGKSAEDANFGGIGMMLDNERQVVDDYVKSLKEQGYDGIIIKNTRYDASNMGGNNDQYVAFYPNQIKNVNNLNPSKNEDIRYSLSNKDKIAPIRGDYQVYSKDIRNNNLAPLREDITKKPASKNVNYSLSEEPEEINPLEDRNMDEVGKRDVKAYQYENPQVKPYYQEMARYMMSDLDNSVRGERYATDDLDYLGTSRQTTDDIAYLLDEYDYSYDDIKKGLNAIIQDHGAENIAVAKRLEILINERLLNGYTDSLGYEIPANQEYIDLVKSEAPAESEVDYSAFDAMLPVKNELERLSKRDEEKYRKKREKYQEQIDRAKKVSKQNKSELKRNWDNFKTLFVNENNEIDNLAKDSGNKKLTYKADMLNNYVVEAENDINNYQTDYNGKEIGKSVKQLFEPAKEQGLYEAFNDYLINYSNIDRHKYGKGSLRWETTSQRLIDEYEEKYPQFKEWGKDVWQYGKNALNTMEQSGLIDKTLKNKLNKMYPHYVPFMDNADLNMYIGANDEIVPKKTIKSAKGGMSTTEILPMEDALTRYAYSYRKSMRQNDLYSEIVRTLRGNEITDTGAGDTRQEVTDLKESLYKDENGNYLKAYIDGDTKVISISNDLYRALKNDLKYQIKDLEDRLSLITKPLQKATKIKGNLVTSWSPSFIGKNFFKDLQDAMFNSTDTKKFLKYYPSAFNELRKNNTELVRQFRAMYGSAVGQYTGFDTGAMKQATKTKNPFKKFANANEIIELAPRYAEFKASLENGATIEEAMYNAREVTTNFSRGGTITKAINRNGFNFVNASTQGLSKFIRNFTGQNGVKGFTHALVKAVEFGIAPALFNELVFGSGEDKDEDYDALPDYVKDNYYLFKYDDNKFIRIPKGRALSVFGSGARRTLEYMNGEKDAFDGYLTNTWNQIGINNPEESFLLTPLMQAKNNKTWYGGDIVPTRLQDKPAGEQSDEKTDLFSKWLGEHLNISPKKINYVIDQYSGGIGDMVLPFITPEAQSEYDNPLARALAPIRDQFVVNSIDDNKYVSDFYTNNDKLKVQANSEYATDEDVLKYKYSNSISSELSALYKEKRLIQNDSSLSNSEKYKKAQAIKQQINEIAKEGLDNYEKVSVVGNYAEVNDREYYRNNKNEWTKAKEEDIEEMNKLGLTAREKNNYYNSKNTISTITTKYKNLSATASEEEKDQLSAMKKSEIINTIKATNITNDAKAYLYGKYYSSDEKMNVITTLDIDMDKYLDFELQDFKSDKDATGKTIRNSKKNKMLKYINSMDGTYGEKLIIYKLNNMTDDSYNREIINYLNSQNLSQEEKRTILKALGMKIDNAGNVRW